MKILVCLLCAAAALLQAPSASAFCLLPQPRLVCAEYFASQFVVEATLLQTEVLHDKNDPEGISARLYTLRVDGVLRGKVVGRIRIYEGNDSGRAPFEWNRGTKYLLFLFYLPGQKSWSLDGCGNSRPLSEAKATFSEIELIRAAHGGGVIHGAVIKEDLATRVPGVHVEAQGDMGAHAAITDERGEFQMKVPVGQYSVHVLGNRASFKKDSISYEDPERIRIEPGGCVQVELDEVEGTR